MRHRAIKEYSSYGVSTRDERNFSSFLWESWEAIRAFAGDDLEKAVYYPEDQKFLLALEPTVTHYEVPLPLEEDILFFLHGKETLR